MDLLRRLIRFAFCLLMLTVSVACTSHAVELDEERAAELAWQALQPNTSSRNRAAWQITLIEQVSGTDTTEQFSSEAAAGGCVPGPAVPANQEINPQATYWHVQFQPLPATPLSPEEGEMMSATAPPRIPEPFLYRADLLLEAESGKVVARRLYCVIY